MRSHDLIIVFFGTISEVIGTISGFGSSTYFVPLALFFENFTFVITITAFLHTFSNLFKIFYFRKEHQRELLLKLVLPSVALCALGALFVTETNIDLIKLSLGLFMLVLSALAFINISRPQRLSANKAIALCSLSGFLTGFIGTGGAIRGIALGGLNLSKEAFVYLSSMIDTGGDVLRLSIYLSKGYMEWEQWYYLPLLFVAASIGTYIGKKMLARIPQLTFEKIVLVFTSISGVLLIWNAAQNMLG